MIICVTGKMAAGKNYICSQLEKEGFVSLDADKMVHSVIEKKTQEIISAFSSIAKESGINLENPDGTLNRRQLGKLLFQNPQLLKKQESIVYPQLIEDTKNYIEENPSKNIILNATVLYKVPELLSLCEKILFVTASPIKRLLRAKKRDKMPLRQILSRFRTQKNLLKLYKNSGIPVEIIKN